MQPRGPTPALYTPHVQSPFSLYKQMAPAAQQPGHSLGWPQIVGPQYPSKSAISFPLETTDGGPWAVAGATAEVCCASLAGGEWSNVCRSSRPVSGPHLELPAQRGRRHIPSNGNVILPAALAPPPGHYWMLVRGGHEGRRRRRRRCSEGGDSPALPQRMSLTSGCRCCQMSPPCLCGRMQQLAIMTGRRRSSRKRCSWRQGPPPCPPLPTWSCRLPLNQRDV